VEDNYREKPQFPLRRWGNMIGSSDGERRHVRRVLLIEVKVERSTRFFSLMSHLGQPDTPASLVTTSLLTTHAGSTEIKVPPAIGPRKVS